MAVISLGTLLRDARKEHGYTQEHLADALHVSRKTISNWENNRYEPDYEMLKQLSQLLELDASALLGQYAALPAESPGQTDFFPGAEGADSCALYAARKKAAARRRLALAVALAALLAAAVAFLVWSPWQSRAPYSVDWFRQEALPVEGQAFVRLYSHDSPIRLEQPTPTLPAAWSFSVILKEENGVGCTVNSVVLYKLDRRGHWTTRPLTGDFFWQRLPSGKSTIGSGEFRSIAFHDTETEPPVGLGLCVQGVDDAGHDVCFRAWFPFEAEG